jgi:phosphate transport system permease protein
VTTRQRGGSSRVQITDRVVRALCVLATVIALVPLGSILSYVVVRGARGLTWEFFTSLPHPVGEPGGGMGNAILGTMELVGLACLIGVPVGIAAGLFLAQFGNGRAGWIVRFAADVLGGVPSIVVGLFAYSILVRPMHHFSALAGAVALSIIMLPTITRTTEELLRLVPSVLREGALALGVPQWRATLLVILRTALPGILTGVMLAVARVAGETAPLLFTALGSSFWTTRIDQPMASLPVQIFTYAVAPYAEWQQKAWTGALVLVGLVLILNVSARLLVRGSPR